MMRVIICGSETQGSINFDDATSVIVTLNVYEQCMANEYQFSTIYRERQSNVLHGLNL